VPSLSAPGGPELVRRLFEPLGWSVETASVPLDPEFPEWGNSRYVDVNLTGTLRLADALKQHYVLLPALDGAKHYRVSQDEADKLLRAGEGWLAGHPERKLIANRYLVRRKSYVNYALAQLAEPDEVPAEAEPLVTEVPEQPQPLAVQRQGSVLAALRAAGAKRVLDLGCGGGALLGVLMRDSSFTEIVGLDVSVGALNTAERRLKLDQLPEQARARITLRQSALTYADPSLSGYDAAVLMEGHRACRRRAPARARTRRILGRSATHGPRHHAELGVQRALRVLAGRHFPAQRPPVRMDPRAVPRVGRSRRRPVQLPGAPVARRPGGPRNGSADAAGRLHHPRGGFRMKLTIPDMSLVVLVGASGSRKSTFGRTHFVPTQVLSSDFFRGLVSDDENDQSVSAEAFDALHYIAAKRLAAGRVTVIDATNVQRGPRADLVRLAKEHNVLATAIVLDLPERVCLARNENRPDRDFGAHVIRRQRGDLRRSLKSLQKEGFRRIHVLRTEEEVAEAEIVLEPLMNDKRDLTGPFDVIGDVHGCRGELEELLAELGYLPTSGSLRHPDGRTAVFVGDLVDRGPDTPGVLRLVMAMVSSGDALVVCGNHEQKLVRALRGRKVQLSHGLAESLDQLAAQDEEFRVKVEAFCDSLIAHYVLDGGKLVVAHAGLPERYHGRASGRVRSVALYGDTTGETDEYGLPVRYPWARDYRGSATVLYGHTPTPEVEWINGTLCLDTGCVFGGKLTALRYPEREIVEVKAKQIWYEPTKPLLSDVQQREPAVPVAREWSSNLPAT
jgi:predicted kinase/2-polyprenyl-3-methyl-5-hydroxy-6-metoxy-1,4-benzoquinol methylase